MSGIDIRQEREMAGSRYLIVGGERVRESKKNKKFYYFLVLLARTS